MKFSLKKKIYVIFVVAIIVPMILLTVLFNSYTKKMLIQQIRDADLKTISTIEASIQNKLSTLEQYGLRIANDPDTKNFLREANRIGEQDKLAYISMDPSPIIEKFEGDALSPYLTFVSQDGFLVGEHLLNRERLNVIISQSMFRSLRTDQVNWEKMYTIEDVKTNEKYKVFLCLVPVHDEHNVNLGFVVLYLDERDLAESYSSYQNRIYILDEKKKIISHTNQDYLQKDYYQATNTGYSYVLQNASTIINNNVVLTSKFLDMFDWQIVMLTSFDEYSRENLYANVYLIASLSIIFLFSIVIGFMISTYITKPIRKLNDAMTLVDRGQLSTRHDHRSKDEIGLLSQKFNRMLDKIQSLMSQIVEEERKEQHYKLQLIQSQVKPHFLYNALEMINSLVRLDLKQQALDATFHISNFYRLSLSDGSDIITIEEEIKLLNHYLYIQKMRYVEFIDFHIDVDDAILEYTIPKLTLQPIVENSIYHGIKELNRKGNILVSGRLNGDRIELIVEDNGKGIPPDTLAELNSIKLPSKYFGINSVKERIDLYFKMNTSIVIESEVNHYTKTTITIPCKGV